MFIAIDADYLVYSCGFASEAEPLENCLHNVKSKLNRYIADIEAMFGKAEYQVYLSPKRTFRDELTTTYKANRKGKKKPEHYSDTRDYLITHWSACIPDGVEADDIVAIDHMKRWKSDPASTIIAACDKDLWTVPGWHYNTYAGKYTFEYIDMFTAEYNLYTQMLTGDTVDNIKGVPKVGPKKAEKLLCEAATVEELEEAVKNCYKEVFAEDWEEQYTLNYKLLYILREATDV